MQAMAWIAVSGLLAASGQAGGEVAAHGVEWRVGHNEGPFADDMLDWSQPRRVVVVLTDEGPVPRKIALRGREKLELVVERSSATACRSEVVLGGGRLRAAAPEAQPVVITVLAYGGVDALDLSCAVGVAAPRR